MKKQRKLIIGFMMLLALVVSGFTYAYWAGGITVTQAGNETNTINIGEGNTVTTTVTVTGSTAGNEVLVPVGRESQSTVPVGKTAVSAITYSFTVVWAGTSDSNSTTGAKADLTVTPTLSGLDASVIGLFTVTAASTQNVTYGSTTTITITVTFATEPANQAAYALVANQNLTLTVSFALGAVTPA